MNLNLAASDAYKRKSRIAYKRQFKLMTAFRGVVIFVIRIALVKLKCLAEYFCGAKGFVPACRNTRFVKGFVQSLGAVRGVCFDRSE